VFIFQYPKKLNNKHKHVTNIINIINRTT